MTSTLLLTFYPLMSQLTHYSFLKYQLVITILMESGWCPVAGLHSGSMKRHRDLDKHSCGKTIAPHEQTCAVALNMASAGTPHSHSPRCSFMLSILIKDIIKTALHPVSLWFSTFFAMCSCFILH